MPQNMELTYLDIKFPRGEAVRLALHIGGVPFTDKRIAFNQLPELKATGALPFGSVPVLTVDGDTISQSSALLRYAGKLAKLYPTEDDVLALRIDQFTSGVDDVITTMLKSSDVKDRAEWAKTVAPRFIGGLEAVAKKNSKSQTWVCGNSLSIADLWLYTLVGMVKDSFFAGVPANLFDNYPRLMASFNAVHGHTKVAEWNKNHPWKTFV